MRLTARLLIAALLASALIGTVAAVAYLYYTWNISATIAEPKVKFYKWSDGSPATTFTYTCNIYNAIERVDKNITYAVYNTDSSAQNVKLRIKSITETSVVSNVTIAVYSADGATLLDSISWTGEGLPTSWTSDITLDANTKHPMGVFITGAAASGSTSITVEMETPG